MLTRYILKRLVLLILLGLLILSSTAVYASRFNRVIYPVVVEDDSGYKFKMKKKPERIISTMPSITEMLYSMNLDDRIVGVTEFCDYPTDISSEVERIGRQKINLEKVVSLEADLIIMLGDAQEKDIERLRSFDLPVFVIDPHTIEDVYEDYEKLGTLTGNYHAAYTTTQWMKRKINWKAAQAKRKSAYEGWTALVIVSKRPTVAVGGNTFIDDMLKTLGIRNVIEKDDSYPKLGKEQILELDPDIIITTSDIAKEPKHIYKDRKFRKTKAGIAKQVLILDPDTISRPGPRLVTAITEIYDFVYKHSADKPPEPKEPDKKEKVGEKGSEKS